MKKIFFTSIVIKALISCSPDCDTKAFESDKNEILKLSEYQEYSAIIIKNFKLFETQNNEYYLTTSQVLDSLFKINRNKPIRFQRVSLNKKDSTIIFEPNESDIIMCGDTIFYHSIIFSSKSLKDEYRRKSIAEDETRFSRKKIGDHWYYEINSSLVFTP